jgi:hypothetical protein
MDDCAVIGFGCPIRQRGACCSRLAVWRRFFDVAFPGHTATQRRGYNALAILYEHAADGLVPPLPLRRGEDKGAGLSACRASPCITLTLPLSLSKGEATRRGN